MKITTVLTAVNNNPKYTRFIPLFISRWKTLYPDIRIEIIFIGNSIPTQYSEYLEHIRLFPEINGISSVYIAQTIRLLYPALLGPDETVVITDIDMLPGNRSYFIDTISHIEANTFISMRPLTVVNAGQIAMCYCVAESRLWSTVFGVVSIEDVANFLVKNYKPADGKHGGRGWFQDQELLYSYVHKSRCKFVALDDNYYKRHDPVFSRYNKEAFVMNVRSESCSDIHLYADACPWNENDIINLKL